MVATYPHVKSGKIKLIAVSSARRYGALADTATVAETFPGFVTGSWQGLLAPAGTPRPIIEKWHAELMRIMALPDIRERLGVLGAEANAMTPAQFGDWLKAEVRTMARVVKEGKVTAD